MMLDVDEVTESCNECDASSMQADSWSAATDESGIFDDLENTPAYLYHHDFVSTGATLLQDAKVGRSPFQDPQDIRLVVLKPAFDFDAPLHMSFAVTNLRSPRAYCGFSYAWGRTYPDGSHLTETVYPESMPLRVTSHLCQELKRTRELWVRAGTDHPECANMGCLWIDAICIDQIDVLERNHQVALMGQIYSKAQAVLMWLGESAPATATRDPLQKPSDNRRIIFDLPKDVRPFLV